VGFLTILNDQPFYEISLQNLWLDFKIIVPASKITIQAQGQATLVSE